MELGSATGWGLRAHICADPWLWWIGPQAAAASRSRPCRTPAGVGVNVGRVDSAETGGRKPSGVWPAKLLGQF